MSNPALSDGLTPDRLADLRMLASGATRRPDGRPFDVARGRIAWFARHGYIEVRPAPPRSTPEQRRACVTVTERGCQAIAEDDARRARIWEVARREMMP